MNGFFDNRRWMLAALWLASPHKVDGAETVDWSETLASRFSTSWRAAEQEKLELRSTLSKLPDISASDFGGPAGFLSDRISGSFIAPYEHKWLQVEWKLPEMVDLVALVPARQFDEYGLDPQYGLPEDFKVLLLDERGNAVKTLADEHGTGQDPVRKGHPFLYRVDPPVRCWGLRIESTRSHRHPPRPGNWQFMAWGEIYCFYGERNVACHAHVKASDAIPSPWPWKPAYVVDESNGLGLPEIADPDNVQIGWISSGHAQREEPVWVQIDLGKPLVSDGLRMFPPQRVVGDLMPGFGYPERFVVEVSVTGLPDSYQTAFDQSEEDFENPGHHAATLNWPGIEGRYVRFRSLSLSKMIKAYPAFLGFSELELLHNGVNISHGCRVDASENSNPVPAHGILQWSAASLTDGHTSRGKIVSNREWLELLEKRYQVETAIHRLDVKAASIAGRFRNLTFTAGGLAGAFMLGALIVLPVRHRRSEGRKLRQVRSQIAADLHDEIGSSLGSIQLLTEAALRKPEMAGDRLTTIRLLSTGSVASLRDIVWLLRPGSAFQSPVLDHFRETAAILLDELEWDFESDVASRECRLSRDINRQLLLFFREALHNTVRHAKCRSINIRTAVEDRRFTLEIRDNGCGISNEKLASPFCLRALKERANRLGGTFEVISQPGHGTTVILQFPVTRTNSI